MEKIAVLQNKRWLASFVLRHKSEIEKLQLEFNNLFNLAGNESHSCAIQMSFMIVLLSAFLRAAKQNGVPKSELEAALKALNEDLNKT